MKPTENTFSFSIKAMRTQAETPNEKVELLESPESFDLFDKFVRGARERECANTRITRTTDCADVCTDIALPPFPWVLPSPSQHGTERSRFLASGWGFVALTLRLTVVWLMGLTRHEPSVRGSFWAPLHTARNDRALSLVLRFS